MLVVEFYFINVDHEKTGVKFQNNPLILLVGILLHTAMYRVLTTRVRTPDTDDEKKLIHLI